MIGDAERRLTAAMVGNGAAGAGAVEAWVAPRKSEVERIRMAIHEIANSGLTLSKLSVAASLLGDLVKAEAFQPVQAPAGRHQVRAPLATKKNPKQIRAWGSLVVASTQAYWPGGGVSGDGGAARSA